MTYLLHSWIYMQVMDRVANISNYVSFANATADVIAV